MALDVGDARIGVAISDPLGLTAQPFCSIERKGKKQELHALLQLINEQQIGTVVVGLPLELSGAVGEQAKKVESFVERFKQALTSNHDLSQVRVEFWDERLTTVEAERIIAGRNLKNKERRRALDRTAAALILQSYLGSGRR